MVQRLVNNGASESEIQKARDLCKTFGPLDEEMEGYHYLLAY